MNVQILQKGLIEWFQIVPTDKKSWGQINMGCKKLYHQYHPEEDPSFAKNKIFYPLLRLGLIEFYGSGTYGLAPSCCLVGKSHLVFINTPSSILGSQHIRASQLNSIIITDRTTETLKISKENNIPIIDFNLSTALYRIHSFESIITG